jgi:hypothetical protein
LAQEAAAVVEQSRYKHLAYGLGEWAAAEAEAAALSMRQTNTLVVLAPTQSALALVALVALELLM